MKIAFDKEKAIELKNKLAKEYFDNHKKRMKRYTIGLVISSITGVLGALLCIIVGITKNGIDLVLGTALAAIILVLSVCAIAHYHDERMTEMLDYEDSTGKYRLPPSVVYYNLTSKGKIFSIKKGEDVGDYNRIRFYAKDNSGKVISDVIKAKREIIDVFDDNIQEVLDLDSGKLFIPKRIKDTTIEEIDNAYAYLKGM